MINGEAPANAAMPTIPALNAIDCDFGCMNVMQWDEQFNDMLRSVGQ